MGTPKKRATETRQIRISNVARQNIEDIIRYIAFVNEQPLNAIKASEAIEKAIGKIAEHPFAYKECERLPTKTKRYR